VSNSIHSDLDAPDSPIDVSSTPNSPTSDLDSYWIKELGLKIRDKHLIEDGYWLNDRVINAAMALLRNIAPNVGGLQDTIVAKKDGFVHTPETDEVLQIINVRGNHWITLSNLQCFPFEMCIYDSLHGINIKKEQKKISYPIDVEMTACQLSKPRLGLTMCVENVQQQKGGNDCGLFSIALATLLSLGQDPSRVLFDQKVMRKQLIRSIEERNMARFTEEVCTPIENKNVLILYEWKCRVFCHCKMPDDGKMMVQCVLCKGWFHTECEVGEFKDPDWICSNCQKKKSKEASKNQVNAFLLELQSTATKFPVESQPAQELYNAIASINKDYKLPDAETHIGCMTMNDYLTISNEKRKCSLFGVTVSFQVPKYDFFIVIFHEEINSDQRFLEVVLHEMAHALDTDGIENHGKPFKKMAKYLIRAVKKNQDKLPKPYRDIKIEKDNVLKAKS
jgi:hypothetical protein